MMGEAVRWGAATLAGASDSPRLDAELLLAHVARVGRSAVIAFPERPLAPEAARRFAELIARRAAGEPIAYLVGVREFHSLPLAVGPAVLVPRPETEHLVEAALARLAAVQRPRVLDLGTGSGAIALAIKSARPDAAVTGADVSEAALAVARANGRRLGLDVEWLVSDWCAALGARSFSAIICNPPYVASDDPHLVQLAHEPRAALDGGPDGLDAIRKILRDAPRHLDHRGDDSRADDGLLLLEHGVGQQQRIIELAAAAGFELLEAGRDLAGLDRFVVLAR